MFVERGFDNVTVTEIAEAAGVSKVTVFNYFPRKEDIFFDRVPAGRGAAHRRRRGTGGADESPVAALRAAVRGPRRAGAPDRRLPGPVRRVLAHRARLAGAACPGPRGDGRAGGHLAGLLAEPARPASAADRRARAGRVPHRRSSRAPPACWPASRRPPTSPPTTSPRSRPRFDTLAGGLHDHDHETGTIRTDGATLYYERRGSGPALLMISGGGGDAGYYSGRRRAARRHVHRAHLRPARQLPQHGRRPDRAAADGAAERATRWPCSPTTT